MTRSLEEGNHLGRALIASRVLGRGATPADTRAILEPVLESPHGLHTLVGALLHVSDWAAAVLHRHAETVGMHPEKLFQGIALELNLDPTPTPE